MLRVGGVDPQGVVVGVGFRCGVGAECLAGVGRDEQRHARDVDAPVVGRIDAHLAEVERPRAQVVDLHPRLAPVGRAEHAAGLHALAGAGRLAGHGARVGAVGLDDGVGHAGILVRDVNAATATRPVGQTPG